jgi:pimeloyl-ACP methyl ester carboxylesterase
MSTIGNLEAAGNRTASTIQKGMVMQATPEAGSPEATSPTVVLVHGAFADASGWAGVISRLQAQGIAVVAPPNPLRGVSSDAAYIASVVNQIPGPVLLVGHSYGGAVITVAGASTPNALGLVYVAAFAPDEGETLLALAEQFHSPVGAALRPAEYPAASGEVGHELYIDQGMFHELFCADLPAEQAAIMAVSQRPGADVGFGEPVPAAAWKSLPSWFAVATQDQTIGVDALRFFAERMGAVTTEIDASHVVFISQPDAITDLIVAALGTVG